MIRLCCFVVFCLVAVEVPNAQAAEPTDFARDIAPILQGRCVRCHSSDKPKGEFSISTKAEFLLGGEMGPPIVVGKPDESLLLEMVSGAKPDMPAEGPPLSKQQIDRLRAWIAEGAPWPVGFKLEERAAGGLDWWAFQPVKRSEPPRVNQERWPRNEIDRFVLAKLEAQQLSPSPEADRRTFIRRLSFDLLGLPPTPEQVVAFVADNDPAAPEKLVDAFLSSPHYGERWARHWLDTAHYADTHGFERDQRRDHAWPYRDYVIKSLNKDKPYDEFLREQIAGDVLRPDDAEAIIATGFLAAGPWDFVGQVETASPTLKRAARADDLDDMLTQVLTAACAVTINCARCHDHKLDPISQREYYQLSAVFAGVKRGDRDLTATKKDANPQRAKLLSERERVHSALEKLSPARMDLADIVGGGDGHGTGKVGAGIDQLTGKPQQDKREFVADVKPNEFQESPLKFVDGVVVPQPSKEGTPITSTGIKVTDVPQTSAQVWDAIRSGPVNSQFSTKLGDVDFAGSGHSLLALHANAAITFDLAELRASGAPQEMKFTASVGYFGQTLKDGASYYVYLDGKLVAHRAGIGRDDGLLPLDIAIAAKNRFLTLMATDHGNGISHDQICFGDPHLTEAATTDLSETQRQEKANLEERLRDIDRSLQDFPAIAKVYAAVSETPPDVQLLYRGDPEQPRDAVKPGALECLSGVSGTLVANGAEGERRRALAEWIVDPQHPLTRRVIVNRLWHYHFGVGIVDTPSDFGFGGGRPTHPELLDWLASELANHNGSLKHLHRLICTSATYRQQSLHDRKPERDVDSNNRLLWRMNARRLEAEALRDSVLAVSGKLNVQMYGPGFRDFDYTEAYAPIYDYVVADKPELWRRTVYRFTVRTTAQPFLTTLDCPNPANLTPARNVTTTALQSLALLNNEFMLRQSGYLAGRVEREAGNDVRLQVVRAFELAFARAPREAELAAGVKLVEAHGLRQLCRMLLNANEFVHVD
jgi:mono/diheme cytochrome c family protein